MGRESPGIRAGGARAPAVGGGGSGWDWEGVTVVCERSQPVPPWGTRREVGGGTSGGHFPGPALPV